MSTIPDDGLLKVGRALRLGVPDHEAALRFGETARAPGAFKGNRALMLRDEPAFELSFWCGTCPFLFQREYAANETLSLDSVQDMLAAGGDDIDPDVVSSFAALLGEDDYLPLLLQVSPVLVNPSDPGDYFSHEEVATWGNNAFWGLPENPRTPYYRTFQTAVADDAHLYEFVVPMVPPSWNDRARVAEYADQLQGGVLPTAVAVSILDVCQSATHAPEDYYAHWCLTHFLLDGHHKLEAAARSGRPLRLLSLLATGAGLSDREDLDRLLATRRQPQGRRPGPDSAP